MPAPAELPKPLLRGVSHQIAFFVSLLAGAALVVLAASPRARLAAAIYALSLSALLGTSALYHRVDWRNISVRMWMRRLDHAMIYLLIAGTFTPFGLSKLASPEAQTMCIAVWLAAGLGSMLKLFTARAPKWLAAGLYLVLGWAGVWLMPQLLESIGWLGAGLCLAGGLIYSLGAVVYACKRPDPRPRIFGYHEVFHALVLVAAGLHFAVIAVYVVPHTY